MERMINARLWFHESNGILSNIQCGFSQGRGKLDHLVRFETFIRNTFAILPYRLEFLLCTLTPEVQCRLVRRNHVIWRTKITKFWRNGNDSKQPYCMCVIFWTWKLNIRGSWTKWNSEATNPYLAFRVYVKCLKYMKLVSCDTKFNIFKTSHFRIIYSFPSRTFYVYRPCFYFTRKQMTPFYWQQKLPDNREYIKIQEWL